MSRGHLSVRQEISAIIWLQVVAGRGRRPNPRLPVPPDHSPLLHKLGKNRNLCAVAFIETSPGQLDGALSALALSEYFKSMCVKADIEQGFFCQSVASELPGISHLSSSARYGQFWQLNLSLALFSDRTLCDSICACVCVCVGALC